MASPELPEYFEAPVSSLISEPGTEPPDDQVLVNRILQLHKGTLQCREADIPLELIKPRDPYFCLEYPSHAILAFKRMISKGKWVRLLVYWNGHSFTMSDDYGGYLAYRLLHIDPVPCAILGDHPVKLPFVGKAGGWDLLPPITTRRSPLPLRRLISENEIKRHIDARLNEIDNFDRRLNLFPRLVEGAARFSFLLRKPGVLEKEIHGFLYRHPEVLDASASVVLSEVLLGAEYRIDLVLQHQVGSVKRTTLVELENPRHEVFTRSGRPRACVTHAVQQVEDWIRWWRQHPDRVPSPLVPEYPPCGLVVIGRSETLSPEHEKILAHLNANRTVTIFTYDMILSRYKALLRTIIDAQESYTMGQKGGSPRK